MEPIPVLGYALCGRSTIRLGLPAGDVAFYLFTPRRRGRKLRAPASTTRRAVYIRSRARALGIGVPGALLSAVTYEFSGLLYLQTACCILYAAVMTWLPLAFLGAEKAIRATRWLERASWWSVSGLALSQIMASWAGQGSYYALLALGGYVGYRTLLDSPTPNTSGVRGRLLNSALHGGGVLAFGFGLAAAGILPRLEYNALSNLAGGYSVGEGQTGG
jgi:hypothetical protein